MSAYDELHHPPADGDREPDKYLRIAADPVACRAMAAEILDWAFNSDAGLDDLRAVVPLANAWMRLAEMAYKHGEGV